MGVIANPYRLLVGRRALGRPRGESQENIEVDAKYIGSLYEGGGTR
jgi:hypothetical protein